MSNEIDVSEQWWQNQQTCFKFLLKTNFTSDPQDKHIYSKCLTSSMSVNGNYTYLIKFRS